MGWPRWGGALVVAAGALPAMTTAAGGAPGLQGDGRGGEEAAQAAPMVMVGPDVRVAAGEGPLVEYDVGVGSADGRRLLVAGFDPSRGRSVLHLSEDGGWSWATVHLLEQVREGGADPVVAFLPSGDAVFVALSPEPDAVGRPRSRLHVFRSGDGGRHWEPPLILDEHGYDRPVLAVGRGPEGAPARIHLVVRVPSEGRLVVRSSTDGGRSFSPATTVAESSTDPLLAFGAVALPSGELVVPYLTFGADGGQRIDAVTSADGGATFAAPVTVAAPRRSADAARRRAEAGIRSVSGAPAVAVGPSDGTVHVAWATDTEEGSRILVSRSADGGRSWSRATAPRAGGGGEAFQPMLAVSANGTVGLAWLEATVSGDGAWGQNTWFSGSTDGGRSFGNPVRVSSQPSRPRAAGNLAPFAGVLRLRPGETLLFPGSTFSRFPTGGDYLAMAATGADTFHPVWADARRGGYEPWTARITVGTPPVGPGAPGEVRLLESVRVLVEETIPLGDDSVRVRLRLRNAGTDTVWPPLRVEVAPAGEGEGRAAAGSAAGRRTLDFGGALGEPPLLAPGGITGAVPVTVAAPEAGPAPPRLTVYGRTRDPGSTGAGPPPSEGAGDGLSPSGAG